MATGRFIIYDNDGTPLTDIRAASTRSWVLNGVGQVDFAIAYSDIKCRKKFLEYGNLVKIEHSDLPDWIGVIDTPRQWTANYVTIRAYEMGYLLRYRRTPENKTNGSAGTIAKTLINLANKPGDTRIRLGNIFLGGIEREESMGDTIYTHLDNVRKRSGNDWYIVPGMEGGKLVGVFHWLKYAGKDVHDVILTEKNTEVGSYLLTEDGQIVNDLIGYGDADTQGVRIKENQRNRPSIGRYGLREAAITYSGNKTDSTLTANVSADLASHAQPKTIFQAVALDYANTFRRLRLGNRLNVKIAGVGFSAGGGLGYTGQIRIMGMRYSDQRERVELITNDQSVATY